MVNITGSLLHVLWAVFGGTRAHLRSLLCSAPSVWALVSDSTGTLVLLLSPLVFMTKVEESKIQLSGYNWPQWCYIFILDQSVALAVSM